MTDRSNEVAEQVDPRDYLQLMGYPEGEVPADASPRARELADEAREWYRAHGSPRREVAATRVLHTDMDSVELEAGDNTHRLASPGLAKRVRHANATELYVVGSTAGAELDAEVDRRWEAAPDEAYFLDRFGAAVVRHLMGRAQVEALLGTPARRVRLLPVYGPGYIGWDLNEQEKLMSILFESRAVAPTPIALLPSGMLTPRCSQLGVFVAVNDGGPH